MGADDNAMMTLHQQAEAEAGDTEIHHCLGPPPPLMSSRQQSSRKIMLLLCLVIIGAIPYRHLGAIAQGDVGVQLHFVQPTYLAGSVEPYVLMGGQQTELGSMKWGNKLS